MALLVRIALLFLIATTASAQYHDNASLAKRLAEIAREHADRVAVRSIASTRGGAEIWCATIGGAGADGRPAVLVVGGVEGSRVAGSELALRIVERLAADRSDSVRALLERTTFYVIPRASPDALAAFFARPRAERATNLTPRDDDRDGAVDEDGPDDLDGNGVITQMRVRGAAGRWIVDPRDPRTMREADASRGERGLYELYLESRDDDGDRSFAEDAVGGVDINRNFPFNYKPFAPGTGEHAVSEIETRALADFCYDHQNIAAVFAFSPQGNLVTPWEPRGEGAPGGPGARVIRTVREADREPLARLSALYNEIVATKGAPAAVKGEGSFVEWAYYHFGRVALGVPSWWMPAAAEARDTASEPRGSTRAGRESAPALADTLAWLERAGIADAYVPWKRFEHPDFPGREVEIGGVAPYATTEPPAALLDSLAALNTRFVLRLGALLPRIELADLVTEPLGDGLTRVRATIVNTGFLPTLLAMGETSRVPLDVKAELTLERGQSVASGRRVQLVGPLAGSGGSKELSWVISGRGEVALRIGGPMAGSIERAIRLGR